MTRYVVIFMILVGCDAVSTGVGIAGGGYEAGLLVPWVAIALKVVGCIAMLALVAMLEPRYRTVATIPGLIALTLPVAWNLGQLVV